MSVEVIVFNDLHLADKAPQSRADDYTQEGLDMLSEVVELAQQRRATLVSTGDFFHVKTPWKNSHALIRRVLDILSRLDERVLVVPGNHDMTERGLASLPSQPLGVLEQAGAIEILEYDNPYVIGDVALMARPYDIKRDAEPSYYALTDRERKAKGGRHCIVVAHGSVVPSGETRPYPIVEVNQIDWTDIDVLVSGHIHEDLGTHVIPWGEGLSPDRTFTFSNVGSLGRVAKTLSNLARTVKVVSIHSDGMVEEIPLKSARPALDIFLPDTPETKQDDDAIQEFVTNLTRGLGADSIDLLDLVHQGDVPENIREHLLHYLQEAGA